MAKDIRLSLSEAHTTYGEVRTAEVEVGEDEAELGGLHLVAEQVEHSGGVEQLAPYASRLGLARSCANWVVLMEVKKRSTSTGSTTPYIRP